jgi:hypothetical protein
MTKSRIPVMVSSRQNHCIASIFVIRHEHARDARFVSMGIDGNMRNVFRRHLFLLIGLLSLCLFFLVAGLDRAGKSETGHALAGPMRVLIVPMYLVWIVISIAQVAIVGPVGLPDPFGAIVSNISLIAGLAPYAFVDYVLDRWQAATRKVSANHTLNARLNASPKEGRPEEHREE